MTPEMEQTLNELLNTTRALWVEIVHFCEANQVMILVIAAVLSALFGFLQLLKRSAPKPAHGGANAGIAAEHKSEASNTNAELWRKLPRWLIIMAVYKGWIDSDDRSDYELRYMRLLGKLNRTISEEGKIHFVRSLAADAKLKDDYEDQSDLLFLARDLAYTLKDNSGNEHFLALYTSISDDYAALTDAHSQKVYEEQTYRWQEKTTALIRTSLENKSGIQKRLIIIPRNEAEWFLHGYLWYAKGCPTGTYEKHLMEDGQWARHGEVVMSAFGIQFRNPIEGIHIRSHLWSRGLWGIIPSSHAQASDFDGSFVFGELIERVHSLIKNGRKFQKYPEASLLKGVEELKATQAIEAEMPEQIMEVLTRAEQRG